MKKRNRIAWKYPEGTLCSVEWCDHGAEKRGWCGTHYSQWRRRGEVTGEQYRRPNGSEAAPCKASDCLDGAQSKGYCPRHWAHFKRTGVAEFIPLTAEERFWEKVVKDKFISPERPDLGYCWLYTGAKVRGYGTFWDGNKNVSAHRYSYALAHGSEPEAMTLDHLCYTRNCVNQDHLEPVTISENVVRAHGKVHYVVIMSTEGSA